jgi:hypothetical protein
MSHGIKIGAISTKCVVSMEKKEGGPCALMILSWISKYHQISKLLWSQGLRPTTCQQYLSTFESAVTQPEWSSAWSNRP